MPGPVQNQSRLYAGGDAGASLPNETTGTPAGNEALDEHVAAYSKAFKKHATKNLKTVGPMGDREPNEYNAAVDKANSDAHDAALKEMRDRAQGLYEKSAPREAATPAKR